MATSVRLMVRYEEERMEEHISEQPRVTAAIKSVVGDGGARAGLVLDLVTCCGGLSWLQDGNGGGFAKIRAILSHDGTGGDGGFGWKGGGNWWFGFDLGGIGMVSGMEVDGGNGERGGWRHDGGDGVGLGGIFKNDGGGDLQVERDNPPRKTYQRQPRVVESNEGQKLKKRAAEDMETTPDEEEGGNPFRFQG